MNRAGQTAPEGRRPPRAAHARLGSNTLARIYNKTTRHDGCLVWTAFVHRTLGPAIRVDGATVSVQRLLFLLAYPSLAEAAEHGVWRCRRDARCVEPAHGRVLVEAGELREKERAA